MGKIRIKRDVKLNSQHIRIQNIHAAIFHSITCIPKDGGDGNYCSNFMENNNTCSIQLNPLT